jgi:hypothetical protein
MTEPTFAILSHLLEDFIKVSVRDKDKYSSFISKNKKKLKM